MSPLIITACFQAALLLIGEIAQAQVLSRQKPPAEQCLAPRLSDLPHFVASQSPLLGRPAGHSLCSPDPQHPVGFMRVQQTCFTQQVFV